MKKEIRTEIKINASAEKIWKILTNFGEYPSWNPFIKSISGNAVVGERIKAYIAPPEAQAMTFTPKVLVFEKNKEFRWIGNLLFKGLFDGEHYFQIIENEEGGCTFIQGEKFSGILVASFQKMLDVNTVNGFNLMNQKLKELAEKN